MVEEQDRRGRKQTILSLADYEQREQEEVGIEFDNGNCDDLLQQINNITTQAETQEERKSSIYTEYNNNSMFIGFED